MKTAFAKELHRAMSMHGVSAADLAVILGVPWTKWALDPEWNPSTGWFYFEGRVPAMPTDPFQQRVLLMLVANADNDINVWKHRCFAARQRAWVFGRGISGTQGRVELYRKAYAEAMVWTPAYWWSRLTWFVENNTIFRWRRWRHRRIQAWLSGGDRRA